jgi:alpha-glucosidase
MANKPQVEAAWWRGAVLYQVYPLSFCDSNGDGYGDLPGLISRLDYIAALGVDGIWISPFYPSPMKDFGYDVSDYCGVDPRFGTLADFDRMIARAHTLGLKVIIDQVWSHSSDAHPWFRNSRSSVDAKYSDWYIWKDAKPDGTPPNNWLAVFGGGAWTWEPRRRQYYLHHFLPSQPQLNLRNEKVLAALFEAAAFWLDRGVDGFRLDAIDHAFHDEKLSDNPPRNHKETPVKPYAFQQHLHDMMQPEMTGFLERIRAFTDRWPGLGGGRFAAPQCALYRWQPQAPAHRLCLGLHAAGFHARGVPGGDPGAPRRRRGLDHLGLQQSRRRPGRDALGRECRAYELCAPAHGSAAHLAWQCLPLSRRGAGLART